MDKQAKAKILLFIALLLVVVTIIVVILANNINNNGNNNGNNGSKDIVVNKEITRLKSEELFFRLQNVIQKDMISSSFIATSIYYNNDKTINYYFINGYSYSFDYDSDYNKNVNYLIIVKNNKYSIEKLQNNIDILNYAKEYDIRNIELNGKELPSYYVSEQNKIIGYIAMYKNLLGIDPDRAYSMLGELTKEKYSNVAVFKYNINSINRVIRTNISKYDVSISDNKNIYKVSNDKGYSLEIIEEYPNDFKINF